MAGYANKSGEKKVRAEKKIGCRGVYNQTVMFIGHKSIWAFCENVASKQRHSDLKLRNPFGDFGNYNCQLFQTIKSLLMRVKIKLRISTLHTNVLSTGRAFLCSWLKSQKNFYAMHEFLSDYFTNGIIKNRSL